MRIAKIIVSMGVTLSIMVVIFMFSAQDGGQSGSLSTAVAHMLATVFVPGFDAMGLSEQAALIDQLAWPIRKTAHATEYACLAISLVIACWQLYAWRCDSNPSAHRLTTRITRTGLVAFAVAVLYAASDEIHQLFIDGRAGQVTDVLVDASGAAIGCILCCLIMYAFLKRHEARV
mgnify:CR=1 FL=1